MVVKEKRQHENTQLSQFDMDDPLRDVDHIPDKLKKNVKKNLKRDTKSGKIIAGKVYGVKK